MITDGPLAAAPTDLAVDTSGAGRGEADELVGADPALGVRAEATPASERSVDGRSPVAEPAPATSVTNDAACGTDERTGCG
jgi:hypothetical protein